MGELLRSEEMALVQLIFQSETAFPCVAELGKLGLLQFRDLTDNVNQFNKKFIKEVRRCDEMERILRFINKQLMINDIPSPMYNPSSPLLLERVGEVGIPAPKDLLEIEETLRDLELDISEHVKNIEALKKNKNELMEIRHVFDKLGASVEDNSYFGSRYDDADGRDEEACLLEHSGGGALGMYLGHLTGAVETKRVSVMESIIWRVGRGNVFLKTVKVSDDLSVFIAYFQGAQLKYKLRKICESIQARVYTVPSTHSERIDMIRQLETRLHEVHSVLDRTEKHYTNLLKNPPLKDNLQRWWMEVIKVKAVYDILNQCGRTDSGSIVAEAWVPVKEMEAVQAGLYRGIERVGTTVLPLLVRLDETALKPPTYHKTNKYTEAFQALVDAYGVANYQEINPAVYTIITFPFLFGVMFGDMGHGIIMLIMALYLIRHERRMRYQVLDDITQIVFSGRYIVVLMAIFSIYCGFVYNDAFSKSINFFGTSWGPPQHYNKTDPYVKFNPNDTGVFESRPYFYGMDPIWQIAANKIVWTNSFKMKSAVVMGIMQMVFGLVVSYKNTQFFKSRLNFIGIFLPRMIFMCSIFVYLVLCILFKWLFWDVTNADCAPSLLINLIGMFMLKRPVRCIGEHNSVTPTMIYGDLQYPLQMLLITIGILCIPWMLILKPYVLYKRHLSKTEGRGQYVRLDTGADRWGMQLDDLIENESPDDNHHGGDEHEFDITEIAIDSIIETIEFCLNCISHTASYLRLWALSLAHSQLSEVLWTMLLQISLKMPGHWGVVAKWVLFMFFGALTVGILICMEGLSAFLHGLRLHWVEFQSKFYGGEGRLFTPFSFKAIFAEHNFDA